MAPAGDIRAPPVLALVLKVAFITIHNDIDVGQFEIERHCDVTMT